ncbi:MAG: hypothetical protein EPN91_00510 [Salinibacterium sp.]|nr:MAG: hypothetical protein EPN91_00510 [Salinibacterium sp.]
MTQSSTPIGTQRRTSTREEAAVDLAPFVEQHLDHAGAYRVPSSRGGVSYTVTRDTCNCADFTRRQPALCKHAMAVRIHLGESVTESGAIDEAIAVETERTTHLHATGREVDRLREANKLLAARVAELECEIRCAFEVYTRDAQRMSGEVTEFDIAMSRLAATVEQ